VTDVNNILQILLLKFIKDSIQKTVAAMVLTFFSQRIFLDQPNC